MPDVDPNVSGLQVAVRWRPDVGLCGPGTADQRVVPSFPFLCDYKRVWDIDLAKDAYAELREWFRWKDPLHLHEPEIFAKLGYIDVQFLARASAAKSGWRSA